MKSLGISLLLTIVVGFFWQSFTITPVISTILLFVIIGAFLFGSIIDNSLSDSIDVRKKEPERYI